MKITKEKIFEEIGYEPRPEQWEIHNSEARFKVACCGVRFGKSVMGARDLTAGLFVPDSRYWIVGPTYALGEKEFRVVHSDMVEKLGLGQKCHISYNIEAGNMAIHFKTMNSYLKVVSAERPKGLKGEELNGAVMAEAAELPKAIWDGYVRARLADRRGWADFFSTPKGFNYFYEFWVRGQDPNFANWESWTYPSWVNSLVFPDGEMDAEIEDMRRGNSDTFFAQEIGAQFTTFEGKIYDEFSENVHVRPIRYNTEWKNYWAIDFGYANPTVVLDVMVSPTEDVYVWREYYIRRKDIMEHLEALQGRDDPDDYHVDAMFGDPAAAGDIALMSRHIGMVFADKVEWIRGINEIKTLLKPNPSTGRPKLFIDVSCRNLIREMHGLRLEANVRMMDNRNFKEAQHKYDDHACDALRYFVNEYFVLGYGSHLTADFAERQRGPIFHGLKAVTMGSKF